jgi:amino-acid N-acetyltransferase
MDLRSLSSAELGPAQRLLEASGLPTEDLADPAIALVGAFDGGALLGVVGLQACEAHGLLRSLAVTPTARGRGIAQALCEHVFAAASARGLEGPWLLTTSARDYFARLGFVAVAREQAPAAIRATAQFASLCPASAVVMVRAVAR